MLGQQRLGALERVRRILMLRLYQSLSDKAFCQLHNKHNDDKIEEDVEVWINQALERKLKQNDESRRNL
jgi:hypothetical protein